MARTVVSGPPAGEVEAGGAPSGDADTPEDAHTPEDADTPERDAPSPFEWSVPSDGDEISDFFGPDRGHLNRVAIGVVAAIFAVALIAALVAGLSGGKSASAPAKSGSRHHAGAVNGARATAALLTLTDFPAGWTGAGTTAITHSPAWSKRLAACVGVPARVANAKPAKVSSPVFTSGDKAAALEETVSQYPTSAQALAEYKSIARAKTPKCIDSVGAAALRASIQSEAGNTATVGTVSITPIPAGTLQPHETGIRVTIPLATSAGQMTINSTEVDFVQGKLFEQLNFNGNGNPFPPLLEVELIDAAMHRAGS